MDGTPEEKAAPDVGPLILALAKTYHWAGLYGESHPTLVKRVGELHAALLDRIAREPEGQLFLGIARDRILYRNQFLGEKQELVGRLTESLYLRQVATIGFGPEVTPESLLDLFRYLHETGEKEAPPAPEQFLQRKGVRGISLSPFNYRELLSRKIVEPDGSDAQGGNREEELWRLLLTSDSSDRDDEAKIMEDLLHTPALFQAILQRAKKAEGRRDLPSADGSPVSGEVLRKILGRLSALIRSLPEDRQAEVLSSIAAGPEMQQPGGTGEEGSYELLFARALTDGRSDEDFLDLIANLLALEGKGGERLRMSFSILAGERNADHSLLAKVEDRVRECRKVKNYYAQKTWEAVEKLILSRGEDQYLRDDHLRFLEELPSIRESYFARFGKPPEDGLGIGRAFGEGETRRNTLLVLLDVLRLESREEDFLDILEDFRKAIPNLVSQKEFSTLHAILSGLDSIRRAVRAEWRGKVQEILDATDFQHIARLHVSGEIEGDDSGKMMDILVRFGDAAAKPLLDQLLLEPEAARRRSLIRLLAGMGPSVVPETLNRMSHPKWYYVRNLCTILGDVGDRSAVESLIKATEHEDYRVKREAILAIGKLAAPEAVPGLGRILAEERFFSSQKDDQIRIDAASALYRIGGSEAAAFLERATGARRPAVRSHCRELLRSAQETR
ncbi:MAG TPA: HEAT repeat domain-containing protein [Candidatus Aquicultoraceae bacterium]|nr:HEAT repeat domain-containing protein [Candidatus Aquicultoraceae bacterium]